MLKMKETNKKKWKNEKMIKWKVVDCFITKWKKLNVVTDVVVEV